MSGARAIDVDGTSYVLEPQPVRTSLTDDPSMMWGFQVYVRRAGDLMGIKTCFVGRVGIHATDPQALEGSIEDLLPVLHRRAFEKVIERIGEGETGDEILFA